MACAAVTDEFFALLKGDGKSVRVGERCRGVTGLDPVVLALRAVGIARKTAALTKALESVTSAGQQFVHVGLMPGVPKQDVLGRFEDAVQRQRQFDHSEVRTQMAPRRIGRDRLDDELSDLLAQLVELGVGQFQEVGGRFNGGQNHLTILLSTLKSAVAAATGSGTLT